MTEIAKAFQDGNLPLPMIPTRWAEKLREIEDWLYATGAAAPEVSIYQIDEFERLALAAEVEEELIIGHQGYGTNNWALHYYLIQTELVILLQMPWGGAYQNAEKCLENIRQTCDQLQEFLTQFNQAQTTQRLQSGRLVIVQSHISASRWGLAPNQATRIGAELSGPNWIYDPAPLAAATQHLRQRATVSAG